MSRNNPSKLDLVLIRGIMSSSLHWWEFLPLLRESLPNFHVHTPDILGNGTKHLHLTPLSPKKNVHGLKEQVRTQGKKVLIGFSLGGMLAVEWAQLHPGEVAGIILINSSLTGSPFWRRFTPGSFFRVLATGLHRDIKKREEKVLSMTTHLRHKDLPEIAKIFTSIENKHPTQAINFIRQLYVATQISMHNQKPDVPILIINSKQDKIVHPSCSHKISKNWNLDLKIHETGGHDLSLDDPTWVISNIQVWLKAHGLGATN